MGALLRVQRTVEVVDRLLPVGRGDECLVIRANLDARAQQRAVHLGAVAAPAVALDRHDVDEAERASRFEPLTISCSAPSTSSFTST